jgi:hypothetical protein
MARVSYHHLPTLGKCGLGWGEGQIRQPQAAPVPILDWIEDEPPSIREEPGDEDRLPGQARQRKIVEPHAP